MTIFQNLRLAWRLGRFDGSAAAAYSNETRDAWRSFLAMPLVLMIGYASSDVSVLALTGEDAPPKGPVLLEVAVFIIGWLAQIVIACEIARFLGKGDLLARYVVAHNWTSVIQQGVIALGLGLFFAAGASKDLMVFWASIAAFWAFAYDWFVGKTALELTFGQATSIIFAKLIVAISIVNMKSSYLQSLSG